MQLTPLRIFIHSKVRDRLDRKDTWFYWHNAHLLRASFNPEVCVRIKLSKKFERTVLEQAQHLLAPLADHEDCRLEKRTWRCLTYCPPTPFGDYHWLFTVEMVQEIIWMHTEFLEGFHYARKPIKQHNRESPYKEPSRDSSWDHGYILGLSYPKVRDWFNKRQKENE